MESNVIHCIWRNTGGTVMYCIECNRDGTVIQILYFSQSKLIGDKQFVSFGTGKVRLCTYVIASNRDGTRYHTHILSGVVERLH